MEPVKNKNKNKTINFSANAEFFFDQVFIENNQFVFGVQRPKAFSFTTFIEWYGFDKCCFCLNGAIGLKKWAWGEDLLLAST